MSVVVDAKDLDNKLTSKLTELAQQIRMPGFRPGKVPVPLLRKTYGQRVMGEVLEETVNESTSKVLEDKELRPAMQPKIEITKFEDGSDLEYTIAVELMPTIEPIDFSGIKLERMVAEVADSAVDERLNALAEQMKSFSDAAEGQAAAEGDAVVIDFKGSIDGEAFDGGAANDFQLELGSGSFIPGFEDQLVGLKAGESKTVEVTFPEEYGSADLAGKAAEFAVDVKQVKVPLPVPVDDSLAEKLGLENLDALRTSLRDQMGQDYAGLSRARLKRTLLDALDEAQQFEVPPGMVEAEFEAIWGQVTKDLEDQGKTIADLDKPEEEAKGEYRKIAERRVRLGLLLSEVGRQNNIEVSQEELTRAIADQARRFQGQEQQVFEYFQSNAEAQAQLRAPLLEDKVVDFILEMADVTDRTVDLDELMRDPDDDGTAEPDAGAEKA